MSLFGFIECSANALLYKRSEVEEYFFRAARMLMQSVRYLNPLCCLADSGTNASDVTTTTKVLLRSNASQQ